MKNSESLEALIRALVSRENMSASDIVADVREAVGLRAHIKPIECDVCHDPLPSLRRRYYAYAGSITARFGPDSVVCPECCDKEVNVETRVLYVPAYRGWNGDVVPLGDVVLDREYAERVVEAYRAQDNGGADVFLAVCEQTPWRADRATEGE